MFYVLDKLPRNFESKCLIKYLNFPTQRLKNLLSNESVRHHDAAKLVALYALRYEKHASNALPSLIEALKARGAPEQLLKNVVNLLEYGGAHARQSDLFGLQDAVKITKRLFKVGGFDVFVLLSYYCSSSP